jgi:hypothetical protein
VTRALHTVVEQLDQHDRFTLVACAEEARLLASGTPGPERSALVDGIQRLAGVSLGDETDLGRGVALALAALRRGRAETARGQDAPALAEHMLLLTDGFTRRPDACLQLAAESAAEGVAITTIGLGSEFQEQLLTALADRTGGRALFLRRPTEIPRAIARELQATRVVAIRSARLRIALAPGVRLRRATRIRPALALLYEHGALSEPIQTLARPEIVLGDVVPGASVVLLLELLAQPELNGSLAQIVLQADGASVASTELVATRQTDPLALPAEVRDAAARANALRLQQRAIEALRGGDDAEAARLLNAVADRFAVLGEAALAAAAQEQATRATTGRTSSIATKELTYATRRLGQERAGY